MELTPEAIKKALQPVVDPEIGISVVDLGLIRDIQITPEGVVTVRMTLTSPFCPEGPAIVQEVEQTVRFLPGVKEAAVELVWNPPWDPRTEASDEVKAMLGIWD
ncbi:MAG: metal-sulfur cluster assembly factor [Acidobacteriota bacterium]